MITEDYVSFETAKLLKEKGFVENTPVNYFVGDDKPRGCAVGEMIYHKRLEEDTHLIAAPTLQMAIKWLRKEYNLYVTSIPNGLGEYVFYPGIYKRFEFGWNLLESSLGGFQNEEFSSPEEACEAAIKYCLENLI